MMKLITVLLVIVSGSMAGAAEKPDSSAAKKNSKNMSFDDLLIQGNFHFSNEHSTTVEEDKVLDSLLSIRKDFKDRIKRSAAAN